MVSDQFWQLLQAMGHKLKKFAIFNIYQSGGEDILFWLNKSELLKFEV